MLEDIKKVIIDGTSKEILDKVTESIKNAVDTKGIHKGIDEVKGSLESHHGTVDVNVKSLNKQISAIIEDLEQLLKANIESKQAAGEYKSKIEVLINSQKNVIQLQDDIQKSVQSFNAERESGIHQIIDMLKILREQIVVMSESNAERFLAVEKGISKIVDSFKKRDELQNTKLSIIVEKLERQDAELFELVRLLSIPWYKKIIGIKLNKSEVL